MLALIVEAVLVKLTSTKTKVRSAARRLQVAVPILGTTRIPTRRFCFCTVVPDHVPAPESHRSVSAHWRASSSQAPYRSLPHLCESSFASLLLLSPKSHATFRGPCFRTLCPDHISSDGYSIVRTIDPLIMFGQRGAKKEVIRTGFFRFLSLVKPWEAHFRGVFWEKR